MKANPILLQKKYSRIIESFANQKGLSLDEALRFFYYSKFAGVSGKRKNERSRVRRST